MAHVKGCISEKDISCISNLIREVGSRLSQLRDRLTAEEGLPRRKSGLAADQWVSGQALGRAALWLLRNKAEWAWSWAGPPHLVPLKRLCLRYLCPCQGGEAGKLEGWHEYILDIQLVYGHGEQVVEWLSFGGRLSQNLSLFTVVMRNSRIPENFIQIKRENLSSHCRC